MPNSTCCYLLVATCFKTQAKSWPAKKASFEVRPRVEIVERSLSTLRCPRRTLRELRTQFQKERKLGARSVRGGKAALLQQRTYVGISPAELTIRFCTIGGVAGRKDVLPHLLRGRLVEDVAC